jgi:hypothetical protein
LSRSSSIVPSTLKSGRALGGNGPINDSVDLETCLRERPDRCVKLSLDQTVARVDDDGLSDAHA